MKKLEQAIAAKQARFDNLVAETITVAVELEALRQAYRNQLGELFLALCDKEPAAKVKDKPRTKLH